MKKNKPQFSKKRRLHFNVLMFLFPFLLLIIFELLLRAFSFGNNMHLIINHPNKHYKKYYSINPKIGEKYFNKFDATGATNDIFLKKKPQNGFRIFVLGSSTLVGFPYEKNLMSSRILHERLQDAYPHNEIEVVNTSITAINSITLNDYISEIIKYEPDAILIYAGHNEYYGAFGIGSNETMSQNKKIRNLHLSMMNWRIYQLLRLTYTKFEYSLSHKDNVADSKGSLMKRIVADQNIIYKSEEYSFGINQFRTNIIEILNKASKNKIPVFISDLVSNVKDISPLGSSTTSDYNKANIAYNQAITKLGENDTIEAKELFYKAKDLDPVRFRASEEINKVITSLAKEYNCYFVPTKKLFTEESKGGLIGNNLMTEHVHPNISGQFLLADAFYTTIVNSKIIAKEVSPYNLKVSEYYKKNWGYTALDSLIGEYRVKQLKSYWPFTSLENNTTFRDIYKPNSIIDSLAFSVLLTSKPNVENLHESLATNYLSEENYVKALKEYETLIRINPYWSNYYNQAVNCYLKLDDLYSAEKYLLKSIKYKQTYFAYLMLAEIETIKHNFAAAVIAFEKALSLAESDNEKYDILKKLYSVYHYNKDFEKKEIMGEKLDKEGVRYEDVTPEIAFSYSNYVPYNVKDYIQKAKK